MPIFAGMTASVPYVSEKGLASSLALIPSPKLQFAPSTNPFACGFLACPLSAKNLTGTASTSGSMPTAVVTTTTLSTTFASASSVPPITTDDYEVVSVDGQEDA
ncbi:hypothetical protein Tco_1354424 [Tanacetum coccineum]